MDLLGFRDGCSSGLLSTLDFGSRIIIRVACLGIRGGRRGEVEREMKVEWRGTAVAVWKAYMMGCVESE